ncbi:MAG TPA: hypothetical protein PKD83_05435 [Ignavibacteria bacterium]|nr:hypothetical protein [Ignavibacteria bacterium]
MKKFILKTLLVSVAFTLLINGRISSQNKTQENVSISSEYDTIQKNTIKESYTAPVKFIIKEQGEIQLSIFNFKGDFIETIVDGEMVPGEYCVFFKTFEKLESGLYYYTISINGKNEITKAINFYN